MTREEALKLLEAKVKTANLIKHSLAVEAGMRELARHFAEDEEQWALTGLLHDIDYEETKDKPEEHSLAGAQFLKNQGLDDGIVEAVKTHNEGHGLPPQSLMAKSVFCLDPLTGLIVAATLVLPSKKIGDLTGENVLNRFREAGFARGAKREIIEQCSSLLGLSLEQFIALALLGMQKISAALSL